MQEIDSNNDCFNDSIDLFSFNDVQTYSIDSLKHLSCLMDKVCDKRKNSEFNPIDLFSSKLINCCTCNNEFQKSYAESILNSLWPNNYGNNSSSTSEKLDL